jgi:hypothetical protein
MGGGGKTYRQDKTPWGTKPITTTPLLPVSLVWVKPIIGKSGISSSRCSGQEPNIVILCTVMKTFFCEDFPHQQPKVS